jgi:hypothetical protein
LAFFWLRGSDPVVRALVAVVFFAVFVAVPATAQPSPGQDVKQVAALLGQVGLIGAWAIDCGEPASPSNPHVEVSVPEQGPVKEVHDLGAEFSANEYVILTAGRSGKDRVSLDVVFQPGTENEQRQKLIIEVNGDSRRTLFNQPAGEPVRVKDGQVVGANLQTPVLKKCE